MSFLNRIFGGRGERAALGSLYEAVVARARDPFWFRGGGVADTIDGRFAMVSSLLALVLLRIEREQGPAPRRAAILLTETFIDDMDGTVRELGIGDQVVGKHVGRMMSALGGRLGAYREAEGDGAAFAAAVRRNVFRDEPPSDEALAAVAGGLAAFRDGLAALHYDRLLAGDLP